MLCFSSRLSVVPRLLFLSFDMQTISSTTLEFSLSISCKTGSLTCSGNACICRDYLHLFKLLLHLSLSSENLHQPRSFKYLEPELIHTNELLMLLCMVLYIHHVHLIVFFSMFLFHEEILCTEYSANDISHAIQKYKMDAILRGNILLGHNKFRTVLYPFLFYEHLFFHKWLRSYEAAP